MSGSDAGSTAAQLPFATADTATFFLGLHTYPPSPPVAVSIDNVVFTPLP